MRLARWLRSAAPPPLLEALRGLQQRQRRPRSAARLQDAVRGKAGIEIGGPSLVFRQCVPVYPLVASLDGVNFAHETLWEGQIAAGRSFSYSGDRVGVQYVAEATDLSFIASGRYDFLLSSNCLEHIANPLRALREWKRVIAPGGHLLLVLPNKVANFDHRRPDTPFEHLLQDLAMDTSEHDLTHLDEIIALHDLARDPPAGSPEQFLARSRQNFRYRALHHHVFSAQLIEQMFDFLELRLVEADVNATDFFALGQVPSCAGIGGHSIGGR